MVNVQLVGDNALAFKPLRAALAGFDSVRLRAPADGADLVLMEHSLGAERTAARLSEVAAEHPRATIVALALERGDRYRWILFRRAASGFAVRGAGTAALSDILRASLAEAPAKQQVARHVASPAMPRSTA